MVLDVLVLGHYLRLSWHTDTSSDGDARLHFLPRDASAERGDATVSRLSVRNVQVPCSHRLEFFENNFTAE